VRSAALLVALAATLAAGCGTTSSSRVVTTAAETTTAAPAPSAGAGFRARADAICSSYTRERLRLPRRPATVAAVRRSQAALLAIFRRQERGLRRLRPPPSQTPLFEAWLANQIQLANSYATVREPLLRLAIGVGSTASLRHDQQLVQVRLVALTQRLAGLSAQLGLKRCFVDG
jgi:hypothetical protein